MATTSTMVTTSNSLPTSRWLMGSFLPGLFLVRLRSRMRSIGPKVKGSHENTSSVPHRVQLRCHRVRPGRLPGHTGQRRYHSRRHHHRHGR